MVHFSKSHFYCSLCQTRQNATVISTIKSIHHYWYYFILVCQLCTIEDKSVGTLEHLQPFPALLPHPCPMLKVAKKCCMCMTTTSASIGRSQRRGGRQNLFNNNLNLFQVKHKHIENIACPKDFYPGL